MKYWVYRAVISSMALIAGSAFAQINPILVTVYDKPITQLDLAEKKQWLENSKVDDKQLLDNLIASQVFQHAAEQINITVSDKDVDQAIERIKSQHASQDTPSLEDWLTSQHLSYSAYRGKLKEEILRSKLERQQYVPLIDEHDIQAFVHNPKSWRHLPVTLKIAHALVPNNDPSILQAFEACQNDPACFEQLARQHSTTGSAEQGGLLGWRTFNEMPDMMAQVILNHPKHGVLPAIQTDSGTHFIQVQQAQIAQEWVRPLLELEILMLSPDQAQAKKVLNELADSSADLDAYAKTHQQQYRYMPHALLTEQLIDRYPALKDLKPGEYSKPFKSPLGWKIIHLKSASNDPNSPQLWAFYASNWLNNQARQQALDHWQQELIQKADITYWPQIEDAS